MLRAHRQAWAWQDEWVGLTIDDIRQLERETQQILRKKLGRVERPVSEGGDNEEVVEEEVKVVVKSQEAESKLEERRGSQHASREYKGVERRMSARRSYVLTSTTQCSLYLVPAGR